MTNLQYETLQIADIPRRSAAFGKLDGHSVHFTEFGGPLSFNLQTEFRTPDHPYILHLHDAVLIPERFCGRTEDVADSPLPRPWRHLPGRVLTTSDRKIFADSFFRSRIVPPKLRPDEGAKTWQGSLPEPVETIEGDCVLLDLVTRHFGHMLLETPARHWPDLYAEFRMHYRKLKFVAVRTHALPPRAEDWPVYVKLFLQSLCIEPEQIHVVEKPSVIRSLFVPSRLSPLSQYGTNRNYFHLLARSAEWLTETHPPRAGFPPKVYLSRSGNKVTSRVMAEEKAIEAIFARHGFAIVSPESHDLWDQVNLIETATHVAGLAGSQLHLSAFRRTPGLHLFRIAPEWHNPTCDSRMAEFTGTSVTDAVTPAGSHGRGNNRLDFSLSPEELAGITEQIEDWIVSSGAGSRSGAAA